MTIFRRRRRPWARPVAVLLPAAVLVAGCTSTDETATAAVPSPDAKSASYCRSLDQRLPRRVDALDRADPTPRSVFTAGWGDPAIILRCGVPRPAEMDDAEADAVEVDGVDWLLQKQRDGSFRFTSTLRRAYVEVTLPKERTGDGLGPLTAFASPVKKAVPEGIAG